MKRLTLTLVVDDFWPEITIGRELKSEMARAALDAVDAHKITLVEVGVKIGTVRKVKS